MAQRSREVKIRCSTTHMIQKHQIRNQTPKCVHDHWSVGPGSGNAHLTQHTTLLQPTTSYEEGLTTPNAQPYEDGWKKQNKQENGTGEQFEISCKKTYIKCVERSMRPRGRPFNKSRSTEESSVNFRVEKVYSLNCNLIDGFSSAIRQRGRWHAWSGK